MASAAPAASRMRATTIIRNVDEPLNGSGPGGGAIVVTGATRRPSAKRPKPDISTEAPCTLQVKATNKVFQ
jgi:hypothetical protein